MATAEYKEKLGRVLGASIMHVACDSYVGYTRKDYPSGFKIKLSYDKSEEFHDCIRKIGEATVVCNAYVLDGTGFVFSMCKKHDTNKDSKSGAARIGIEHFESYVNKCYEDAKGTNVINIDNTVVTDTDIMINCFHFGDFTEEDCDKLVNEMYRDIELIDRVYTLLDTDQIGLDAAKNIWDMRTIK